MKGEYMRSLFFAAVAAIVLSIPQMANASGSEETMLWQCRTQTTNSQTYLEVFIMDEAGAGLHAMVMEHINGSAHHHHVDIESTSRDENGTETFDGRAFSLLIEGSSSEIHTATIRARFGTRSYAQTLLCSMGE